MIVQGRNGDGISRITRQIDTLHIVPVNGQGLVQFGDVNGHNGIQLVLKAECAFVVAWLNSRRAFTAHEDENRR